MNISLYCEAFHLFALQNDSGSSCMHFSFLSCTNNIFCVESICSFIRRLSWHKVCLLQLESHYCFALNKIELEKHAFKIPKSVSVYISHKVSMIICLRPRTTCYILMFLSYLTTDLDNEKQHPMSILNFLFLNEYKISSESQKNIPIINKFKIF